MLNDEKKSRRSSSNSKKYRGRLSRISELNSPVTVPESSPTAVMKGVHFDEDQDEEYEMVEDDFDALANVT